jgi:hypothetical protein
MKMRSIGPLVAVAVMTCVGLAADDKWETPTGWSDDTNNTPNQLIHGGLQTHDIQGPAQAHPSDVDFSFVAAKARHSYEVKVFSTTSCFYRPNCADVSRVDAFDGATILTAGIRPDSQLRNGAAGWMAVRWTSNADQMDLIRVNGYEDADAALATNQYDIQMLDTTYLVPRWNNSGTQITIFLIQNGTNAPIAGSIFFYNASGAVLHTQPLSLPANGLQVVSTVGIPALAGASGSAAITHDGGYGALAGKAVALEPSTGFAFDTPITPIPH